MKSEFFGFTKSKEPIHRYTISGGGLNAKFINWGAVLQDLCFEKDSRSMVLGLNSMEDYLLHSRYFGATAGPYANRINQGRFKLKNKEIQLQTNFQNQHHLHGGTEGIGKSIWKMESMGSNSIKLSIIHPDGHMGYPGPIKINAQFRLMDPCILDILYSASSEQPTIINLAHHSYFNLSGEKTVLDHELKVHASTFLEVDSGLIPRGNPQPVEKGDCDFREFRTIQSDSFTRSQLDHNFCLSLKPQELRPMAWLKSKGVRMQINTTEPGLQVYDGHGLDVPVSGLDGKFMGPYAGVALEPQLWPDSPNRKDFASPILNPDQVYSQHTQYVFSKRD